MTKNNRTKITGEPGTQEIVITREYDAPRELVFKAYTDPELYIQWQGPRESKITFETFEPKNGGMWRYIYRNKDGNEYVFHGVYHEVTPPKRIINTFEFNDESGFVTLQTVTFEELPGGKTRLMGKAVFQSVADRDREFRILKNGVDEIYDQLAELLEEMQK